ncbi:MAG: AAC(3)-I family aminoglycoside N-acetyltransferase [Cyanobacteria bacterium P01_H01_bin.121]
MALEIHQLTAKDAALMVALVQMFGAAFNDRETYTGNSPSQDYLSRLLNHGMFIALAAVENNTVVGGIAAYELMKFEQERSEIYIYDLAVALEYRRRGIATALIEKLKVIAAKRGASIIFVQADQGIEAEPAIALYTKLGKREDVLHFDIPVSSKCGTP